MRDPRCKRTNLPQWLRTLVCLSPLDISAFSNLCHVHISSSGFAGRSSDKVLRRDMPASNRSDPLGHRRSPPSPVQPSLLIYHPKSEHAPVLGAGARAMGRSACSCSTRTFAPQQCPGHI